jgi:hypothetical protein
MGLMFPEFVIKQYIFVETFLWLCFILQSTLFENQYVTEYCY